jgi:hypothetical protein
VNLDDSQNQYQHHRILSDQPCNCSSITNVLHISCRYCFLRKLLEAGLCIIAKCASDQPLPWYMVAVDARFMSHDDLQCVESQSLLLTLVMMFHDTMHPAWGIEGYHQSCLPDISRKIFSATIPMNMVFMTSFHMSPESIAH